MGVQGTGGVGGGMPRHRPSHVAYYVALVGILALLALLLLYFFYFFIRKVKKLSRVESPTQPPVTSRPPPAVAAYPVQPVVRESASEMAKLCKQLPPPGKGGTVFPTSTSPAARRTDHGEGPSAEPALPGPGAPSVPSAPPLPSGIIPGAPAAAPEPVVLKSAPPATPSVPIVTVTAQ